MKVKDIMTKDVVCMRESDPVKRAAELMSMYDVGSIPVCFNEKVVGVVTDRDIAVRSVASGHSGNVGEIMSTDVQVGYPEMDVHDAARIMSEKQIRRLPIEENGSLVGIVALGDLSDKPELQDNAGWALRNISMPEGSNMTDQ